MAVRQARAVVRTEEAERTAESAFIADVLLLKATLLFEQASRPGASEEVHQEYLEAHQDYEAFMRGWGCVTDRALLAEAAQASNAARLSGDDQDRAAAERDWDRFFDFRAMHREEIRMHEGRSR